MSTLSITVSPKGHEDKKLENIVYWEFLWQILKLKNYI